MFARSLKALRLRSCLSQSALARELSVAQSTVGMWESGKNKPEYRMLMKIAAFFEVGVDELVSEDAPPRRFLIPVLGRVPAGMPIEVCEDIIDYEEISPELASRGEYFALQVKGRSMEPKISDGDVVVVRRQSDAESGSVVVAMINGDEATLKKLIKRQDGVILSPSNPEFEPIFYSGEQIGSLPVRIIGKVIELRCKFE